MNALASYLSRTGVKRSHFARAIGVTPGWITQLCDDNCQPSLAVAVAIERETNGEVKAVDLLSVPALPDAEQRGAA